MDEKWMVYWDNVNVELYALVKQIKKNKKIDGQLQGTLK